METKILIAGIGGVGGYFGGLLAKQFYGSSDTEIFFLARGEHLIEIQNNGLKVIKQGIEFIAKPTFATDRPAEIGIVNVIVVCTKSYDLEKTIEQLQPCINNNTIILPLLNGVDARKRIGNILPNNLVLDGCVYIVSRLTEAGKIENTGNIQLLYLGLDNFENEKLFLLEHLFKKAQIEATLSKKIASIIWEKFIFISPTATATSYFDANIGTLLADTEKLKTLTNLIEEVANLAKAKQIAISDNIIKETIDRLKALPFNATSSMHTDFQNKKDNTELEALTGYVVSEGQKYKVATKTFEQLFNWLMANKISPNVG